MLYDYRVLDDATNSTDLLSVLDTGDYHFIINTIESAETAAHQSFDRVLKVITFDEMFSVIMFTETY